MRSVGRAPHTNLNLAASNFGVFDADANGFRRRQAVVAPLLQIEKEEDEGREGRESGEGGEERGLMHFVHSVRPFQNCSIHL